MAQIGNQIIGSAIIGGSSSASGGPITNARVTQLGMTVIMPSPVPNAQVTQAGMVLIVPSFLSAVQPIMQVIT